MWWGFKPFYRFNPWWNPYGFGRFGGFGRHGGYGGYNPWRGGSWRNKRWFW